MLKNGDAQPSKLTKVLVKKVHGGRKQDSKFWQSEFVDQGNEFNIPLENQGREGSSAASPLFQHTDLANY